jgi:phosphonate transport system substrate-binding protein
LNKTVTFAIAASAVVVLVFAWTLYTGRTAPVPAHASPIAKPAALRIGIIPERDIYQQRKNYLLLAQYLQSRGVGVGSPPAVEVMTAASYDAILQDFNDGHIDAAFVGSLVAVLAADRYGTQVVLKSENLQGQSTYCGVIFVPAASPVTSFRDLIGQRIGAVRTTTAGAVYPLYLVRQLGWQAKDVPTLVWSGTHDDVIREVLAANGPGDLAAGAVKDTRLAAFEKAHPDIKLRHLAESGRVPDNALIVRRDLPPAQKDKLVSTLLAMEHDPNAAPVLASLELHRFLPCSLDQYAALYDMIDAIGPVWFAMQVGPAPRRPAALGTAAAAADGDDGRRP